MRIVFLITSLFLSPIQEETLKDIGTALKTGSSKELIKFCNQTVDFKVNGEGSNYSKVQAEVIFRDFFSKNPPKDFFYIHKGASQGLKYTIGRYTHESGAYRVVMVTKKIDDKYLIDTLHFNKE